MILCKLLKKAANACHTGVFNERYFASLYFLHFSKDMLLPSSKWKSKLNVVAALPNYKQSNFRRPNLHRHDRVCLKCSVFEIKSSVFKFMYELHCTKPRRIAFTTLLAFVLGSSERTWRHQPHKV